MHKLIAAALLFASGAFSTEASRVDYRVLATTKTSTMEKEMNDAAASGFDFRGVMGGETAFGGKEVVVVMGRRSPGPAPAKLYKLIAANRTSTLERELQSAGSDGFEYRGQTVFESAFGGREVALILERDPAAAARHCVFKLLATSKTSTMQKEIAEAGADGYEMLGMTVGKTALGGSEVISILRKQLE